MKILIKKTLIAMLSVALMLPSVEALAQSQLSGKVIDAGGNPVAGAAVIVEGTSNGVSTDLDGSFTIRAAEGAPIVVSILGYQDARTKLKDGMTVKLMEDSTLLEETVVVGYGSVKKIDLTGSVGSVSNESLVRGGLADAVGACRARSLEFRSSAQTASRAESTTSSSEASTPSAAVHRRSWLWTACRAHPSRASTLMTSSA